MLVMPRESNGIIPTHVTTGSGEGLLIIDNLPGTYTWQNLKDALRRCVPHTIWTDMVIHPWNGHSTGRGYARLNCRKQATEMYVALARRPLEGQQLIVHLWDITVSPPQLLARNCFRTGRPCYPECDRQSVSRVAADMVQTSPNYSAVPAMPYGTPNTPVQPQLSPEMLVQPMAAMQFQPQTASYNYGYEQPRYVQPSNNAYHATAQRPPPPQQIPHQPLYQRSSTGLPMNTVSGFALTEHRGVFIGNLSYSASEKDIRSLFGNLQGFQSCKLKAKTRDKSVGWATVQFDSEEAAGKAIKRYQDHLLKGKRIKLRFDNEPTTVQAPPSGRGSAAPLVVDGSRSGNQAQ